MCFLAALPKAPNNYNPLKYPKNAKARRNWVIKRMLEDRVITPSEAREYSDSNLVVRQRDKTEYVQAKYFAELVRRKLVTRYGEKNCIKEAYMFVPL